MPVIRTYACDQCAHEWNETTATSDDPYPDCPQCGGESGWVPKSFAVTTIKAKAVDYAQAMMEEQGYTDIRDNQREGDIAVMGPAPMHTREAEDITRELIQAAKLESEQVSQLPPNLQEAAQGFWQGGMTTSPMPDGETARTIASVGALAARQDGVDPIGLLHQAGQRGELPFRLHRVTKPVNDAVRR